MSNRQLNIRSSPRSLCHHNSGRIPKKTLNLSWLTRLNTSPTKTIVKFAFRNTSLLGSINGRSYSLPNKSIILAWVSRILPWISIKFKTNIRSSLLDHQPYKLSIDRLEVKGRHSSDNDTTKWKLINLQEILTIHRILKHKRFQGTPSQLLDVTSIERLESGRFETHILANTRTRRTPSTATLGR